MCCLLPELIPFNVEFTQNILPVLAVIFFIAVSTVICFDQCLNPIDPRSLHDTPPAVDTAAVVITEHGSQVDV